MKKKVLFFLSSMMFSGCLIGNNTSQAFSVNGSITGTVIVDGRPYKTVLIGNQEWMAENLNYVPPGKAKNGAWCYDDIDSNCTEYGRLYSWSTAMQLPDSCNHEECFSLVHKWHQGICPSGWHIPSDADWSNLIALLGDSAGYKLKLPKGTWTGNNASGFSAKAGGSRGGNGKFTYSESDAYFWSSTQVDTAFASYMGLGYVGISTVQNISVKWSAKSIRCIKNQ